MLALSSSGKLAYIGDGAFPAAWCIIATEVLAVLHKNRIDAGPGFWGRYRHQTSLSLKGRRKFFPQDAPSDALNVDVHRYRPPSEPENYHRVGGLSTDRWQFHQRTQVRRNDSAESIDNPPGNSLEGACLGERQTCRANRFLYIAQIGSSKSQHVRVLPEEVLRHPLGRLIPNSVG